MKLSCTKDNLFHGLAATSRVTGKNVNLPILQNVLIKADGNTIRLTTTNLEMAVVCQVRGKVDEEGEFSVPSKLFFDYVNLLPNERVDVALEGNALDISCEQNQTKINGMDPSEFPLVPPVEGNRHFSLSIEEFRRAVGQVLFAAATNESRPELAGVAFRFHFAGAGENSLVMAATDSYRLSERVLVVDQGVSTEPLDIIVPGRTLSEVSRILGLFKDDVDAPQSINIHVSEAQIVFEAGTVEVISRTIEGNYPDYEQIIPTQFKTEAVVNKEELLKAVKTASLFSRTGLFDVTLQFDPGASSLTVASNDTSRGANTVQCAGSITGEKNHITLNFRYLLDGLNALETEEVVFGMNDNMNPALLRPKADTANFRYLIMPIKQ